MIHSANINQAPDALCSGSLAGSGVSAERKNSLKSDPVSKIGSGEKRVLLSVKHTFNS